MGINCPAIAASKVSLPLALGRYDPWRSGVGAHGAGRGNWRPFIRRGAVPGSTSLRQSADIHSTKRGEWITGRADFAQRETW